MIISIKKSKYLNKNNQNFIQIQKARTKIVDFEMRKIFKLCFNRYTRIVPKPKLNVINLETWNFDVSSLVEIKGLGKLSRLPNVLIATPETLIFS